MELSNPNGTQSLDELEFIDVEIPVPWGRLIGRWYGERKVRPLLALHGWLDNIGTWNNLLPLLPKHLGVLCIEWPGHGRAPILPKGIMYSSLGFLDLIPLIMREYKWSKVSFLTHSMGARLAIFYASVFPKKVDMLISFDALHPHINPPSVQIKWLQTFVDKFLVADERLNKTDATEPPSYTIDELKRIQHEGTRRSVNQENTQHIYERNVTESRKNPGKFYFSRDARSKYFLRFFLTPSDAASLAMHMVDVPFLVFKPKKSIAIIEESKETYDVLRGNNVHFEMYEMDGTHHLHLNDAHKVADIIKRFIDLHRPALLELSGEESSATKIPQNNVKTSKL